MLLHITTGADWEKAEQLGYLHPPSLESEGFIHLSTATQWRGTAARFFHGRTGLVLLSIDPARLTAEVRYESADGDRFPHLYGRLEVSAVVDVAALVPDATGSLQLAPR
jgi:uncharacterized protein (DUF952 family)